MTMNRTMTTLSDDRLLSQSRVSKKSQNLEEEEEEEEEEEVTPKSEPATAEVKEEVGDHDSEDSFRPEHVAEELQMTHCRVPTSCGSSPAT